ncbi:hypothetical protein [Xanthomonas sp. 4461]|uniref:hypothetical protein n=1 Tax=Xanthomonas sp. 4461 TaxID=3035313 RepID=UPI002167EA23|nr:hypothetical protein [Xanthomonas sp. 4461]MCS3811222.1 hypothetical protein [Xanthomonas sp. 4461]
MEHYFAPVTSKNFPHLSGLVLFQLIDNKQQTYILEIRYKDSEMLKSDGDHLYHEPIGQAMSQAQKTYGIDASEWRLLSPTEAASVERSFSVDKSVIDA